MVRLTQASQSPSCPFYRQGKRGPEKRRDLLKLTQSAGGFEARSSVSQLRPLEVKEQKRNQWGQEAEGNPKELIP